MHSDHTVGYADLILTPWVLGRRVPLEVYGPSGIKAMTEHLLRAGVVYMGANVTVTAFSTKHAMDSYGYRFDASDRSIVIAGDTDPTQATSVHDLRLASRHTALDSALKCSGHSSTGER
jgi:ribonuclease BN (tRNA processing enzyme)